MSKQNGVTAMGTFDYVIVGAGSAGCVLANRLSADPAVRVLLLEAGGRDNWIWIHIPIGYAYAQNNPRTDWCFKTEREPGLNGRAINYPRGRVLGGSSAINGMLYLRGQAADYDGWRQMGNVGWSWADVLPYFKRSEDYIHGADEAHGSGGEWRVEDIECPWPVVGAFREAAAQVGIPPTDDFNRGSNEGCGYFHANTKRGVRWTTAKGFLRPIRGRKNLTILTGATARTLQLEQGRARGIVFTRGGQTAVARCAGEIVLAAGAIGSPQLLQLSGIAAGGLLKDRGVPVVVDAPGVGEGLQDHLLIRIVYQVANATTLNQRVHSLWGRAGMALEYAVRRKGPMALPPCPLGLFAKSEASQATPDLECHVQALSFDPAKGFTLHRFPGMTAAICHLRPHSRGHVRIKDADPGTPPAIQPNYLSAPEDQRAAVRAVRLVRRICAAPALAPFSPSERAPGPEAQSDEAILSAVRDISTTVYHPVGTCRMGPAPSDVVDERLRVRGVAGLRVIDASIMPAITSGNTNSPVIMIAEKGADLVLADRRAS